MELKQQLVLNGHLINGGLNRTFMELKRGRVNRHAHLAMVLIEPLWN